MVDSAPHSTSSDSEAEIIFVTSSISRGWYVELTLIGGLIGFYGYRSAATYIEARIPEPSITYGIQAGLISLPLCVVLLASIGLATAFALKLRFRVAISLLLAEFVVGAGVTALLWSSKITEYGRDSSDYVVYLPPITCSVLALIIAAIIGLIYNTRRPVRKTKQ